MRFRFYSSARAAMTGGDGTFGIGPMLGPDDFAGEYLARFTQYCRALLSMTYEEFVAAQQRSWLTMVLGYDPQLLLPPPAAFGEQR